MPDLRYEVVLNGCKICTSGVDGLGGVLDVILSWSKRKRQPDDEVPDEVDIIESHWFTVGGIDPQTNDHVRWYEEPIKAGDEIIIRILGPGPADEPQERYTFPE